MVPGSLLDSSGNYLQRVCGTLKEDGRDYMQIWEDNECDGTAERWLRYAWDSKEQKFNFVEKSNTPLSFAFFHLLTPFIKIYLYTP